jgi:DNA-binding transcriptional LysR family regulator
VAGDVTISASAALGVVRIVPSLPRLMTAFPALAVTLRLEEHAIDLVGDGVDIAVRAGLALPDTTS